MTIETVTPEVQYTVAGTGPYALLWPYLEDGLTVSLLIGGTYVPLTSADYSASPAIATVSGNLTLTPAVAASAVGTQLLITRNTLTEQGWVGIRGEREKGLEVQLDQTVMAIQELKFGAAATLRTTATLRPFEPVAGRAIIFDANLQPISGPNAIDIANAQAHAAQALISANLAAAFSGRPGFGTQAIYSADTVLTYTAGQPGTVTVGRDVLIGGEAYAVVASGATVFTLQSAGGVKVLYRPGERLALPIAAGVSSSDGVLLWHNTARAAYRYEINDLPAGQNDEMGFFRAMASVAGWQFNPTNIGIGSVSTGRSNLVRAYLSSGHGHSCAALGVASRVGGAGSCTGDPDDPDNADKAYCAEAYGKNVHAFGMHSFARGNGSRAFGTASASVGRLTYAGPSSVAHGAIIGGTTVDDEGLGAVAFGDEAIAFGNGSVAIGPYLISYGGSRLLGAGINPGSPLVNVVPNSTGIGSNVTRATLEVLPGPGTITGVGSVRLRTAAVATAGGLDIADYDGVVRVAIRSIQTHSFSGQSWSAGLFAWITGALTEIAWAGLLSTKGFFPKTPADTRLGDPLRRWSHVFLSNNPDVSSDARLKDHIADLSDAELAAAGELRTQAWVLIADGNPGRGYIAQKIIAAYKTHGLCAIKAGLVSMGDDELFGVNYSAVEAVRAEYLRSRLDALQNINGKD
jgi:hypothetical protein